MHASSNEHMGCKRIGILDQFREDFPANSGQRQTMSIRVTIVFPQACWRDKDAEKKASMALRPKVWVWMGLGSFGESMRFGDIVDSEVITDRVWIRGW